MKQLILFLLILSMLSPLCGISAAALTPMPEISAKQAYIVNLETGRVMVSENTSERVSTGGFAKIMTILLALEKKENLDEMVTVTAAALEGTENATTIDLKVGEQMSLKNLIYCAALRSAADASNAIAIYVGGSVSEFVALMNARAAEIGCKNTHFANATGLDADDGYTTAEDLYLIVKTALENPRFMDFANYQYKNIPATNMSKGRSFPTTNLMIVTNPDISVSDYYLKYARGIMVSSTKNSGYSIITELRKDNVNYICIVMNATFNEETKRRNSYIDAKALCNWVLDNYASAQMLKEKEPVTQVPVKLSSTTDSIVLVAADDCYSIVPSGAALESFEKKITLISDPLKAPIAKDEVLGTVEFFYEGEKYGEGKLLAQTDVGVSSVLYVMDNITGFFGTIYFKIILALLLVGGGVYYLLIVKLNKRRYKNVRRRY